MPDEKQLDPQDLDLLRRLCERKAQMAADPVNLERKAAWYAHDAGAPGRRPMVLAEIGGIRDANQPVPDSLLQCRGEWARRFERWLRVEAWQFDVLRDDHVVEARLCHNWNVQVSDYGVQAVMQHAGPDAGITLGARRWDAPIKDLDRDFARLHPRTYTVDRQPALAEKDRLERLFGDILSIEIRGGYWWTLGMTWPAIELIGLENLMLFMYDNPAGLHRLMAFLRDDHLAFALWLQAEGLLTLNNEDDYIGSGSMGYTRDLPKGNGDRHRSGQSRCNIGTASEPVPVSPVSPVRLSDLWVLLESQETVGVGPDLFEEFIFPYQLAVAQQFGKCYYGCCEPVHNRWHILKRLPNLHRVSVSPWADEAFMAAEFGPRYVFSRKPNPTLVSTRRFDEVAIRADLRRTLDVTAGHGCRTEIIMKDVHTLNNEPGRLPRWVQLAREEIDRTRRL